MKNLKVYSVLAGFGLLVFFVLYAFVLDIKSAYEQKDLVAILGYDPVSFFVEGEPVIGVDDYTYDWNKTTWHFSSDKNKQLFVKNPAAYAPQFGGNCSYSTSLGKEQQGLPKYWQIREGKLYFNSNMVSHFFWKTFSGRLPLAHVEWEKLIKAKEAKRLLESN